MGKRAIALDEHLVTVRHDGRERMGWVGVITDHSGERPINRAMFYEDWAPFDVPDTPDALHAPLCEVHDDTLVQDWGTFATFWEDALNVAWLIRLGEVQPVGALRLVRAVSIARKTFRPQPVQSPDPMVLVDRAHEVHGADPERWPLPALSALISVSGGEADRFEHDVGLRRRWAERLSSWLPEPSGSSDEAVGYPSA